MHRRMRGRRGVTDVPLEIIIIMVVLAIVVPIIISAFTFYSHQQVLTSLSEQAANVGDTAVQVFDDGINTTLLLTVTVPSTGILTIGGPLTLAGGARNAFASFVNYSATWSSTYYTQVNNGAGTIALANATCGVGGLTYSAVVLTGGTNVVALTKLAPGAFFCAQPVTTSYVEVSLV